MTNAKQNEQWGFRWRGAIGVICFIPAGVLTLLSQPLIAEGTLLDLMMDLLAWAAFVAGLIFRLWPTLYVGARKLHTLVIDGPYSICRNPLYVGSFLITISAGLFLKSLTFAVAFALAMFVYMWATLPAEEKRLREEHGVAYDEYCRTVPRYWRRWSLFHTPESVEVKVKGLRIEFKRLLVWIWLPFIGELVAHLRVEAWWPRLLRLP